MLLASRAGGTPLDWMQRRANVESSGAMLARLEVEARVTRRGLWTPSNPVPPWDWRGGEAVPQTAAVW